MSAIGDGMGMELEDLFRGLAVLDFIGIHSLRFCSGSFNEEKEVKMR
jgi:hypothetical protein